MKLPRRQFLHLAAGAAALSTLVHVVWAQDWPTRPVTMVVPYAAGGPLDTGGRLVAPVLSERLGQQVIVENVVGAGGHDRRCPCREGGARRLSVRTKASTRGRCTIP
jgi:hypothetical protein